MKVIRLIRKFNIASEREDYLTIHDIMEKGTEFKGTNLWILIFAIFIASVGLNVNSTAVIIGAMLISPLMGPILGMGYSLATYDLRLFRKSVSNFGFAVISGLSASTLYFLISPISVAHSELLARTSPNIYDVIIALLGGLAGIVAMTSKNKGNVLPGVAIATALMPPLCTAGYGLANANWNYFFGAFYLFTINTVFIGTATMLTVRILKYPVEASSSEKLRKSANRWVSLIGILTMVPSIYFGYLMVQQDHFKRNATAFIRNETFIEGDYLLKTDIDPSLKNIVLTYGGKAIKEDQKKIMESRLKNYDLPKAKLVIKQGFSITDIDKDLSYQDKQQAEINRLKNELAFNTSLQDSILQSQALGKKLFNEIKPLYPDIEYCTAGNQLIYSDSTKSERYYIVLMGTKQVLSLNKEKIKIEKWLRSRLETDSLKLIITNL